MKRKMSGQTAILVVLIGTVVATMGLATVARTVTNVQISTQIENAHMAIQAAEAGVALGLRSDVPTGPGICNISSGLVNVLVEPCNVSDIGDVNVKTSMGKVKKGESRTIWLIPHGTDGNPDLTAPAFTGDLDIDWGSGSLELIQIYQKTGEFKLAKHYYDSPSTLKLSFPDPSDSKAIALRVKPIAEDTDISFTPRTVSFPSQGRIVDSTGRTETGNITRRVVVTRWYPELPAIFDYVLFSYGSLEKN